MSTFSDTKIPTPIYFPIERQTKVRTRFSSSTSCTRFRLDPRSHLKQVSPETRFGCLQVAECINNIRPFSIDSRPSDLARGRLGVTLIKSSLVPGTLRYPRHRKRGEKGNRGRIPLGGNSLGGPLPKKLCLFGVFQTKKQLPSVPSVNAGVNIFKNGEEQQGTTETPRDGR